MACSNIRLEDNPQGIDRGAPSLVLPNECWLVSFALERKCMNQGLINVLHFEEDI